MMLTHCVKCERQEVESASLQQLIRSTMDDQECNIYGQDRGSRGSARAFRLHLATALAALQRDSHTERLHSGWAAEAVCCAQGGVRRFCGCHIVNTPHSAVPRLRISTCRSPHLFQFGTMAFLAVAAFTAAALGDAGDVVRCSVHTAPSPSLASFRPCQRDPGSLHPSFICSLQVRRWQKICFDLTPHTPHHARPSPTRLARTAFSRWCWRHFDRLHLPQPLWFELLQRTALNLQEKPCLVGVAPLVNSSFSGHADPS